ncbi:MAG: MazG nucleotide pyrophosphohydrolase domain-containing protein [Promethearchaeati archaeon SRVP18_Atabeyarchaeia-1]
MTSITEFQRLMRTLYGERDSARGPQGTMLWLVSEVGEFADAMVKHKTLESLKDEAADVLAWLCSVCNVLGIDLQESATSKYANKSCPKCRSSPCQCSSA